MEGDDAEEFVRRYRTEFSVDISDLEKNGELYFSAEGVSPIFVVGYVAVAIILKLTLDLFLPTSWGWVTWIVAFALPWLGLMAWSQLTARPRENEITIRDW
jgi:hypothetical protein